MTALQFRRVASDLVERARVAPGEGASRHFRVGALGALYFVNTRSRVVLRALPPTEVGGLRGLYAFPEGAEAEDVLHLVEEFEREEGRR